MILKVVRFAYQKEPAASLAVITWAAGAITGLTGHPEFTPVLVAVGLAFLGVRAKVVPVTKAAETATQAAQEASTTTALRLNESTVGSAGEITPAAMAIVNDTVSLVTGLMGAKR